MSLFEIDVEKCTRDGACAAECPSGIIRLKEKGDVPSPARDAEEYCIRCGHCVAVCPTGALTHRDMRLDDCPEIARVPEVDPRVLENHLRARRSIRTYRKKPVDRGIITRLIETARYAPSGHNSQPVHWLVIHDSEDVRVMAGLTVDWMRYMLEKDPGFARGLNMDRIVAAWEMGQDKVCRGAPHIVVVHADKNDRTAPPACTLALASLEILAPSLGLGACWAGFFNGAASLWPPMKEALNLPEGHANFGSMMLGYPVYAYHRIPTRKAPPITWR